ncbi:MAG TPA: carboxylesterase family protein [Terracidiphilus sp.]|jgi:para-nitrobenzyl esterase
MQPSPFSRRKFLVNTGLAAAGLRCARLYSLADSSPAIVRTACGVLRGEQSGGVLQFRGIPFAEPPVGPLRFRAPVSVKPWTGERDATRFAAAAMQVGEPGIDHSEDCLYLNIWAPTGKGPFPVYVWIHGGGFTGGHAFESTYDGTALTQQGVICISVAYRLGVFGFLDLEPLLGAEYAGSANNALRDLIAALEWIRENISAFGGDPARVTIGGESAGAKLTDILMGVPSAQPLFHQMVSESGGAERVWTRAQSKSVTHGFGDEWKTVIGTEPSTVLNAPADALIKAQWQFIAHWPQHFPLRCQIDGSLVPLRPVETIASGSSRGKRLLIGTNRDESALFIGPQPEKDPVAADLGNLLPEKFSPVYKKYREVYPQMSDEQLRIRAVTAEEYWIPSMRVADAHLKGAGSAWMYRLDFAETSGSLRGYAFHSLDVRLVWDRPSALVENAAAEADLARQMNQAWIAFVRGETPAAPGVPAWPEYNSTTRPTMIFDTQNHVEQKPQDAEFHLWDGVL